MVGLRVAGALLFAPGVAYGIMLATGSLDKERIEAGAFALFAWLPLLVQVGRSDAPRTLLVTGIALSMLGLLFFPTHDDMLLWPLAGGAVVLGVGMCRASLALGGTSRLVAGASFALAVALATSPAWVVAVAVSFQGRDWPLGFLLLAPFFVLAPLAGAWALLVGRLRSAAAPLVPQVSVP